MNLVVNPVEAKLIQAFVMSRHVLHHSDLPQATVVYALTAEELTLLGTALREAEEQGGVQMREEGNAGLGTWKSTKSAIAKVGATYSEMGIFP